MVAQINAHYARTRPTKVFSRLMSYALFEGRPVTTRGRFFNPIVFASFSLQKRLPQLKKVEKPIFILGTGRSGTTILGVVLSIHREVGFLNEPKALWHSIYDREDVIGSYSSGPAKYRLGGGDVDDEVKGCAHKLFGAYLSTVFSRRLVDKYPELIFRVPFVRQIFPDAKFVFLIRNGWDTCTSIEQWSSNFGLQSNGEIHDWWGVNQRKWKLMVKELVEPDPYFADVLPHLPDLNRQSDMAVLEWVVTMREGMRLMGDLPQDTCAVRYEDLAASPREELSRIAEFAELGLDETFLGYGESVLRPRPRRSEFEIHSAIRPLFDQAMSDLGYE